MIIVIDGPAGSGKSSTARAVADKMDIQYIDSGALYRAITLLYIKSDADEETFFELLNQKAIEFRDLNGTFHVFVDGRDVTGRLRSMEVSEKVSEVASFPESRKVVNDIMRREVEKKDRHFIAEGRDLGTAVFPDADLKIFMSATAEERARRRYDELKNQGEEVSLEEIRDNIRERDRSDSQRASDPLKKAGDAIEIDTTDLSFEQQVDRICSKVRSLSGSDEL